MVLFRRSESGKKIDEEWHEVRQAARVGTFSLDEWAAQDITRYDLDTAQIDGSDNPRTFTWDRDIDILDSNGTDVRTLDTR
jgi:hypothetical protein